MKLLNNNMITNARLKTLVFIFLLIPFTYYSQVRLPKLISNGMVLQRDENIRIWGWASDNEKIIVWSDKVIRPVAVRYAWANNPEGANLYNKEGLPASPFRASELSIQSPSRFNPSFLSSFPERC
jgi:hypothetical protein